MSRRQPGAALRDVLGLSYEPVLVLQGGRNVWVDCRALAYVQIRAA